MANGMLERVPSISFNYEHLEGRRRKVDTKLAGRPCKRPNPMTHVRLVSENTEFPRIVSTTAEPSVIHDFFCGPNAIKH